MSTSGRAVCQYLLGIVVRLDDDDSLFKMPSLEIFKVGAGGLSTFGSLKRVRIKKKEQVILTCVGFCYPFFVALIILKH